MATPKRARTECSADEASVILSGGSALPSCMSSDREKGLFCDVELVCKDGERIAGHRLVLAAGSDYFRARFGLSWSGSPGMEVDLSIVDGAVCKTLLDYMYCGSCLVKKDSLSLVLEAAHYLQMAPLVNSACEAMAVQLNVNNACSTWVLADMLSLVRLSEAANAWVLENIEHIWSTGSFSKLPLALIHKLLLSDCLNASEELVFETVIKWIRLQPEKPSEDDIASLLSLVRFGLLPREAIERAQVDQIVAEHPKGLTILFDAIKDKAFGKPSKSRCTYSIRFHMTLSDLTGWTKHYDEPYMHRTTANILRSVPASASHIFVGAQGPDGKIALGATGPRNKVLGLSSGELQKFGSVYWYFSGYAFGFCGNGTVSADCRRGLDVDNREAEGKDRLSWYVDGEYGGWRAGANHGDIECKRWRKLIFSRI